ncbi:hypothetical protein SAMN04488522_106279 [Pedobacter caeni]|uniref:Uncharacterized protein n=1 Tax=Pedobacter caeni TaxID=288992 RepID=A0A1M5LB53_9SPHI|nr:hypothetical protein SAMN04488522_106279 [Pedobacter caeni]
MRSYFIKRIFFSDISLWVKLLLLLHKDEVPAIPVYGSFLVLRNKHNERTKKHYKP